MSLSTVFTGTADELNTYLDAGYRIGITGWVCDERRGGELARLVPGVPAEKLMLETDAPFLLPRTISPRPSSRRNEPANLTWVVKRVAQLRGENPGALARQTQANAERFFHITGRVAAGFVEDVAEEQSSNHSST